jgi:hypothetical protein
METKKSIPTKFSDEEYARSHEAIAQHRETGRSNVKCLRCGVGIFLVNLVGNSSEARCSTPGCVSERIRGI